MDVIALTNGSIRHDREFQQEMLGRPDTQEYPELRPIVHSLQPTIAGLQKTKL